MQIKVSDRRLVVGIQEEFSAVFPYLKLEFCAKSNTLNGTPSKKLIRNHTKTIGDCRTHHNKGTLAINPNMTVAELEQRFSDVYGLSIQIYRKSGRSTWLETTLTEGWTLAEQNRQGEALSKVVN